MYFMMKFLLESLLSYDYLLNVQHHDHFEYEYKVNDVIYQYDQYSIPERLKITIDRMNQHWEF